MKRFGWFLAGLLVFCGALVTPDRASGKTIEVPGDHQTIQAAVNAASSGDTILVDDGIYKESVKIDKSKLTIKAKNYLGAVIDGEGKRDFGFHAPESANVDQIHIEGFEIRHHESVGILADRKGKRKYNAWTIIENYIHHVVDKGILIGGPRHSIRNNTIAYLGNSGESMGIQLKSSTNSTISDNIIYMVRKNGIRISSSASDNMVKNNLIAYTGPGIAINTDDGANVVMNNYIFMSQKGIITKHSSCLKGNNRIIHNTVVETSEANIVLGENIRKGKGSDCLEVYNNIFADAHKSLIKDTKNRGKKFKIDFNFYDNSLAYMMPNARQKTSFSFHQYQQAKKAGGLSIEGFDQHSKIGDPRLENPFLGPQLQADSPVLRFQANEVKGGLGEQVGARLDQKLPYQFERLPMKVKSSSNFSQVKNTVDGVFGSLGTASGRGPHSITYEIIGTPEYDILWVTPGGHTRPYNVKRFAVSISTDGRSFEKIVTKTVAKTASDEDNGGSALFYEIGRRKARFIKVEFLDNFGDPKFKVDDIWVARRSPTGAADSPVVSTGDPPPSDSILPPPTTLKRLSTSLSK